MNSFHGVLSRKPRPYSLKLKFGKASQVNYEGGDFMRFYTNPHPFYCGIDLHARSMYVCILSHDGELLLHRNMKVLSLASESLHA